MPGQIYRAEDVKRLLEQGAQLVDVLPPEDYEESHLPGALNIPLRQLDATTSSRLDRKRAVIVYCHDFA